MKRAVILHGTDGSPMGNWFPWLEQQLEAVGYQVWVPTLPENHTPNRDLYNDFLLGSDWDFSNNLVIGHSSGAVAILNLLGDERCPNIKAAVLVSAWAQLDGTDLDGEQFKHLFPEAGFAFDSIKARAKQFMIIHSSNDPYCPLNQAEWLSEQLDCQLSVIPNGDHLGSNLSEFPQLLDLLKQSQLA